MTRRDWVQVSIAAAAGFLLWQLFMASQPIGTNVGDLQTVKDIRRDQGSPATVNKAANVTIIVFTDYQCPACRSAEPALQSAARADGRVRIVFKEWPVFGPKSEGAARVALGSAYQGLYPAVHAALMSTALDESAPRRAVEQSGGDWQRLRADLRDHRAAIDAELSRNASQAFSLGLEGTPAYLIGPILVKGALNKREFARVIAAARAVEDGRPPGSP